jgi:hypothetical protein
LATKKKVGEFNKGIFEILKKSPYLDQKNLEVTIFRESRVPIGRQNYVGFPKKSTTPLGQLPFTTN